MSARLLDGQPVAAAIREAVQPDVQAFTAAAGPSAGARHRARRRQPGVGDLRPQQGQGRRRGRAAGRSRSACRRTATLDDLLALVARLNASAVHDGILVQAPLPDAMGKRRGAAGLRRDRSRQGRGRLSSRQRRPAGAGPAAPRAVHAVRRHRDARSLRHPDRRRARRRHRPQRDRRQADGDAAAAARRHGHHLPFEDARPRRGRGRRPTSSLRRSAAPDS